MDGKRARPRKAPRTSPKESVLHIAVANTLRDHALPEWLWWHTPNGGRRDIITASRFKAMGVRPGIPDFLLLPTSGRIHFLEIKRHSETLSAAQEDFQNRAIRHSWPHSVADTLDQALAALNHWGCLRRIGGAP
jgi:hypothetical protein